MSMTSEVSQNTSQGSFLSEATSLNTSNVDGQEELVAKFSDFDNLSKKWGVSDVQQVKYLLRLMLTRKYVAEAEANAVKKKKQAQYRIAFIDFIFSNYSGQSKTNRKNSSGKCVKENLK